MDASILSFVGHGIFTVAEASRYARVSPQLMSRWMFGPEPVLEPKIDSGEDRLVSFVDYVQTLTLRTIRRDPQFQISMPRVRQAIRVLRDKHGISYPFARQHTLYEFEDHVVYQPPQGPPIFVSGQATNQYLNRKIVEPHLRRLVFDESGLAKEHVVATEGPMNIVMRAGQRFGAPMMPSGHTAETLHDALINERGAERAAKAYGVSVEEVEAAYRYYDSLFTAAGRTA